MKKYGILYLIPTPLHREGLEEIPPAVKERVKQLKIFVVEHLKTARWFLKRCDHPLDFNEILFFELNEHTQKDTVHELISPLLEGLEVGLLSEAGLPCVAYPGALLVAMAQQHRIRVVAHSGPSSLMLALMASGFNGQQFNFHGYLPAVSHEREHQLKKLEQEAYRSGYTQIWIETPYRNRQMMESIQKVLRKETLVHVSVDLTGVGTWNQTRSAGQWASIPYPDLNKRPAVFLMAIG
jgi:16S rRNA (cytidine1402-2'-O)-methyltransferase